MAICEACWREDGTHDRRLHAIDRLIRLAEVQPDRGSTPQEVENATASGRRIIERWDLSLGEVEAYVARRQRMEGRPARPAPSSGPSRPQPGPPPGPFHNGGFGPAFNTGTFGNGNVYVTYGPNGITVTFTGH